VVKQKRYRLKQFIPIRTSYRKGEAGDRLNDVRFLDAPYFRANSFIENLDFKPTKAYRLLKKNRAQTEILSTQLSRRLLRTRKTLVLPAHVNLTLITNSYDVVHSWFLPSLGLKMDCVPGRSTHHSFYVDSTGFFYGQCAEICGRYHHHMPIRLCMLPYEHFFVWWQHFGLPKVLGTYNKDRYEASYGARTFA
jgi:heme/copper-type cytochrome/quinol oxidase subunit 2